MTLLPPSRRRLSHWLGLLALIASASAWSQGLVYEREFTLMEGPDNVLRIMLTDSNEMFIERPVFMTRAGTHRVEVDPSLHAELASELSATSALASRASADALARADAELKFVSDPEITRFYRTDADGRKLEQVSAVSISAWLTHYPDDPGLKALNDLEQRWLALMTDALRQEQPQ